MRELVSKLENIPDDQPWNIHLEKDEYILSNFEGVDPAIYERDDLILADVVKIIRGPEAITEKNKIEFSLSDVRLIRSIDGNTVLYAKEAK